MARHFAAEKRHELEPICRCKVGFGFAKPAPLFFPAAKVKLSLKGVNSAKLCLRPQVCTLQRLKYFTQKLSTVAVTARGRPLTLSWPTPTHRGGHLQDILWTAGTNGPLHRVDVLFYHTAQITCLILNTWPSQPWRSQSGRKKFDQITRKIFDSLSYDSV